MAAEHVWGADKQPTFHICAACTAWHISKSDQRLSHIPVAGTRLREVRTVTCCVSARNLTVQNVTYRVSARSFTVRTVTCCVSARNLTVRTVTYRVSARNFTVRTVTYCVSASCKRSSLATIKPTLEEIGQPPSCYCTTIHYHTLFIDVKVEGTSDAPGYCEDVPLLSSFIKKIGRLVQRLKRTTHIFPFGRCGRRIKSPPHSKHNVSTLLRPTS